LNDFPKGFPYLFEDRTPFLFSPLYSNNPFSIFIETRPPYLNNEPAWKAERQSAESDEYYKEP